MAQHNRLDQESFVFLFEIRVCMVPQVPAIKLFFKLLIVNSCPNLDGEII